MRRKGLKDCREVMETGLQALGSVAFGFFLFDGRNGEFGYS